MQIPILSGIFTDESANFRTSYPRNLVPVPKEQGISKGYLRPAEGIVHVCAGVGPDRGAINWNGAHYRVQGNSLVRFAAGALTVLGNIAGSGPVTMDYSFDRLMIAAAGNLYYFAGDALTQVTDPDLGTAIDVMWIDGYTITTDGAAIVQAELNDPTAVNPLKYGSSEADPDPIKGLIKLRNEMHSIGRYTIEQYNNVGGPLFAFERNEGGLIPRGAVSTFAMTIFNDAIAFVGSGQKEAPAVWLGVNGASTKLSTREIDTMLAAHSEAVLAQSVLETRTLKSHLFLYLHLPDQTLVYDAMASAAVQEPVWFTLDSGIDAPAQYRARNFVWCDDAWYCADPLTGEVGRLDETVSTHYGATIGWEFGTSIVYNESRGAIFHEIELITLPGRVPLGIEPIVWTSYSVDGETWSQERACRSGGQGQRSKRITWRRQGSMQNWRIQRFRGTSDAHLAIARLEVQVEPLNA